MSVQPSNIIPWGRSLREYELMFGLTESDLLSLEFHLQSILELCRVAREVRIFPLTGLDCEPSPHLAPLQQDLRRSGFPTEIVKVNYQLQRKGDEMMRISKSTSHA